MVSVCREDGLAAKRGAHEVCDVGHHVELLRREGGREGGREGVEVNGVKFKRERERDENKRGREYVRKEGRE